MDATALIGQAQDAYSLGVQKRVSSDANAQKAADNLKGVKKAAEDFESFFVGQMLEYMWEGVGVDQEFGGGHAEEMWRSMLNQEYGKHIVKNGGLGIANQVMASMLKAQEERTMSEQKLTQVGGKQDTPAGDENTAGAIAAAAAARREG